MITSRPSWILFDLDGTLWDHDTACKDAVLKLCVRYGLSPMSFLPAFRNANEAMWREVAQGRVDFETMRIRRFDMILNQLACGCSSNDAQELSAFYTEHYLAHPRTYAGVRDLLASLRKSYKLGVVTNGPRVIQNEKLRDVDPTGEIFSFTLCPEEARALKPDAAFYAAAEALTGEADRSKLLVVGDSWHEDVIAPRERGWQAVWISNGRPLAEPHVPSVHAARDIASALL